MEGKQLPLSAALTAGDSMLPPELTYVTLATTETFEKRPLELVVEEWLDLYGMPPTDEDMELFPGSLADDVTAYTDEPPSPTNSRGHSRHHSRADGESAASSHE